MKAKPLNKLLLLLLTWLPLMVPAQFLAWDFINVADDIRQSGANPDMVMGSDGTFHISYWQRHEDKLVYAFRSPGDSGWTREYVDLSKFNGYVSAIALQANGQPAIAYQENANNVAQIRYAERISADNWQVAAIPGDAVRGWGGYGPSAYQVVLERVVHSIELIFNEAGEPQIAFFDGWMGLGAFPACTRNSFYGFKLHQAWREFGQWQERSLGNVPDQNLSCGEGAFPDTLPFGDRYGEYAQLLQRNNGRMEVFCLSRFNNRLIKFQNLFPAVDTFWQYHEIDSLTRILEPNDQGFTRFFTIEGISATVSADENTHLAYTTSLFYGENVCCIDTTNDLVYARLTPTDTFYHSFGQGDYRNHTDIVTRGGSDSVFISYIDVGRSMLFLESTADSGSTWVKDTVLTGIASFGQNPMEIQGDSLYLVVYDDFSESLFLTRRHVDGGPWQAELINKTERLGEELDAIVLPSSGDTVAHLVYTDEFQNALYYAYGTKNTGWDWDIEAFPGGRNQLKSIAFTLDNAENPMLSFGVAATGELRFASYVNGQWRLETVDATARVGFTDIEVSGLDTIYLVYYDDLSNCLKLAWRAQQDSVWNLEAIDCANQPVGLYPSLQLDAQGHPKVAYYDSHRFALVYASQNPGTRIWKLDSVTGGSATERGKFASLKFGTDGLPKIAWLDEQANSVFLSEQDIIGNWTHQLVDSASVVNMGRPIRLEIDDFGKVWVAYNYFANAEKVKLMRRENGVFSEVAVSSTSSIAEAFEFEIVGGDLFIPGRKNKPYETGIAMLYAQNGLYVPAPNPTRLANAAHITNFPNPFSEETTFRIAVSQTIRLGLRLYNLYGERVATVFENRTLVAGKHDFKFDGAGLAPGMYIYVLRSGGDFLAKKLILRP